MKPTSIIFMILAAILIVAGVIVCVVGGVMANANDKVELLCDRVDAEGNALTTHSLTEFDLTDIDIDFKNADINIIGQSVESYIEFKNINNVTYDLVINKHKLSLDTVNPFDVASMVKFRENEGGFGGLRHYLYLNKYKKEISEVNIYINPAQALGTVKISTENGDITVKNMTSDTEYELDAFNGNVIFENNTDGDLSVNVKKGNFTFNRSYVGSVDFVVENGNGKFTTDKQYNFSVACQSGKIYLDDENVGDSYLGVYPEKTVAEGEEVVVPDAVNGKITSGDLVIDTAE